MKFREYVQLNESSETLPDNVFDSLIDGNEVEDVDVKQVGEFVQKQKPTLLNVKKLHDMLGTGNKYTTSLKVYLKTIIDGGASSKPKDFRYFDRGQVNFLKSLFDLIRQGATYND